MAPRRIIPVLSVLIALVALAAGAFVWKERRADHFRSEVISRLAPELGPHGFQLLPNLVDAEVVIPDRPHDPREVRSPDRHRRITRVRRFSVSTNSHGFRGPELAEPTPHPRILVVGDSVTFGWGVTLEESYPYRLGRLLGVDVVNAGVPALKPDHMGNWIEQRAAELEPDILLLVARPNHVRADPWGRYARALEQATATGAKVGLVLPPLSTFDVMGTRSQASELRRIRRIAEEVDGGPVPVLDLTDAFRAALPRPGVVLEVQGGRQRVRKLPEQTLVLDVAAPPDGLAPEVIAAFEADPSFAEPLFFDGGHPDAEGHALVAAVVATWAQQNFL